MSQEPTYAEIRDEMLRKDELDEYIVKYVEKNILPLYPEKPETNRKSRRYIEENVIKRSLTLACNIEKYANQYRHHDHQNSYKIWNINHAPSKNV